MRRVSRAKQKKSETSSDGDEEMSDSVKNDDETGFGNDIEIAHTTGKKRNARSRIKTSEETYESTKEEVKQENGKQVNKKRKKDNGHRIENDKNQSDEEKAVNKKKKSKEDKGNIEIHVEEQDMPRESEKLGKNKKKNKIQKEIHIELDAEEYEVEKIVDQRTIKGRRQFLVRWKGYTEESDTWEQEKELNCDRLIEEFLTELDENNEPFEKDIREKIDKTKIKKQRKKSKIQIRSNKVKNDKKLPQQLCTGNKGKDDNNKDIDDSKEYEVEKIIEVHFKKNKKREFLIRWKGFSSNEDTWEPEEHLNCSELINKFMEKLEKIKKFENRELRANPAHTKRYTLTMHGDKRQSRRNADKQRVTYHECDE